LVKKLASDEQGKAAATAERKKCVLEVWSHFPRCWNCGPGGLGGLVCNEALDTAAERIQSCKGAKSMEDRPVMHHAGYLMVNEAGGIKQGWW